MEVTYLAGSAVYELEWSGSSSKICFAIMAETSFLFFPDGLSPGVSLTNVDDEQSWNNILRSATCDVIHATSLSVCLASHVIFVAGSFLVDAGAGVGAKAGAEGGVGPGAVLLPLPYCFFRGIPSTWVAGCADMGGKGLKSSECLSWAQSCQP